MKEAKGHYEYAGDHDGEGEGICAKDGEEWPCPTWKKWIKSDSYRIAMLEEKVQRLILDSAGNRKELSLLRESNRRLNLYVRAGLSLAVADLIRGVPAGSLTERVDRESQDFSTYDGRVHRVASLEEYTVTYEGRPDRKGKRVTWVNGKRTVEYESD